MDVPVNYLAVVIVALVNYAIGSIWYGVLFRKPWMKLAGMSEMKVTAVSVVVALVGALFTSYILAHAVIFASAVVVRLENWPGVRFASAVGPRVDTV